MHDLNTIRRLNAEAHAATIEKARNEGKHVVATFAGLHLMTVETYSDAETALAAAKQPNEAGDSRCYYPPLPGPLAGALSRAEHRLPADLEAA